MDYLDRLDDVCRHIALVRDACVLLGKRLIKSGRVDFGRILIQLGHIHDASKFSGIEWRFLHNENADPIDIETAIEHHRKSNKHHPEFWGGFNNMPEVYMAEMVCDWYARSNEFGTDLKNWIDTEAVLKYNIDTESRKYEQLITFVEILTKNKFNEEVASASSASN